jgi:hypothetical protein
MTELYLDQLTSWRVKSLLCHPAYHDAATTRPYWPEEVFDELPGTPLVLGWARELALDVKEQVGVALTSWAAIKMQRGRNIVTGGNGTGLLFPEPWWRGTLYIKRPSRPSLKPDGAKYGASRIRL